mmetsp:Transcript_41428/g.107302  ORF Transcript_41428/g.107302 Transcript_41428/m.107302 type:complete len:313 (-) Transcript_41428:1095-2033(-)
MRLSISRITLSRASKFCGLWAVTVSGHSNGRIFCAVISTPHCLEMACARPSTHMTVPELLSTVTTLVTVCTILSHSSWSRRVTILLSATMLLKRTPAEVVFRHIACSRGTISALSSRNSMSAVTSVLFFRASSWVEALPESNARIMSGTMHSSTVARGMCATMASLPRSRCIIVSPPAVAMMGCSAGRVVDRKSSLDCFFTMAMTRGTTTPDRASVRSSPSSGGTTRLVSTRVSKRSQKEAKSLMKPAFSRLLRWSMESRNLSARRSTSSVKKGACAMVMAAGRWLGYSDTIAFIVAWNSAGTAEKSREPSV